MSDLFLFILIYVIIGSLAFVITIKKEFKNELLLKEALLLFIYCFCPVLNLFMIYILLHRHFSKIGNIVIWRNKNG